MTNSNQMVSCFECFDDHDDDNNNNNPDDNDESNDKAKLFTEYNSLTLCARSRAFASLSK